MRARRLAAWLATRLIAPARAADFIVGEPSNPYLRRWWLLPRNPVFNVYLHQFMRSDDDRALHDHPWPSLSLTLRGRMMEHTFAESLKERRAHVEFETAIGLDPIHFYDVTPIGEGAIRIRSAGFSHRLELLPGEQCWTLFLTGPVIRKWGFWCDGVRWVYYKIFTDTREGVSVTGRGCE